jgi:hypothetical protein
MGTNRCIALSNDPEHRQPPSTLEQLRQLTDDGI